MSYTVTEATVVFPDKKAASSFSSGYASKKPCAHIDCELEGGFERSIWIPVRVARLYVKNRPDLPCDWDDFREAVQLIERKCALTMVTEMLSRRDHATGEVRDKLARYGFRQAAIDFAVARATEYRFLDENRFCSYFIEERKRRGNPFFSCPWECFFEKARKACNIFLLSFVYFNEAQNRPDGYRSILRIS